MKEPTTALYVRVPLSLRERLKLATEETGSGWRRLKIGDVVIAALDAALPKLPTPKKGKGK
jgi:hypothetical protein